jgi:hypothetical protein
MTCFDRQNTIDKFATSIETCPNLPFLDLIGLLGEAYSIVNPDAAGILELVAEITEAVNEVMNLDSFSTSDYY